MVECPRCKLVSPDSAGFCCECGSSLNNPKAKVSFARAKSPYTAIFIGITPWLIVITMLILLQVGPPEAALLVWGIIMTTGPVFPVLISIILALICLFVLIRAFFRGNRTWACYGLITMIIPPICWYLFL